MTATERSARRRERLFGEILTLRAALIRIKTAKTVREARDVADSVLEDLRLADVPPLVSPYKVPHS
jgi:hypothetical protein